MRIESEEHALNGGLCGFLVIDVAGIFLFDGSDGLAIIRFNFVRLVFLSVGRGGIDDRGMPAGSARSHAAGDGCRDDYQEGDNDEFPGHRRLIGGGFDVTI
jgi:hypothetical protein